MPRKRMINPSFWRDEKIAQCSFMERLLFIGLWTFAEDDGVGRASPLLIKADVFPYETLREADIRKSLDKLASLGLIQLYEVDTQMYYYVTNFKKHQTINKPSQCYLPLPPEIPTATLGVYVVPTEDKHNSNASLPEHYRSTTTLVTSEENIKENKLNRNNIYSEIVSFLNQKTGSTYRPNSQKTQKLIDARLNEGYSLCDFKRVIETKCAQWGHEPKEGDKDMRPYLRPETLFGTKFESYLNQSPPLGVHHEGDPPITPPDWPDSADVSIEDLLGVDFGDR